MVRKIPEIAVYPWPRAGQTRIVLLGAERTSVEKSMALNRGSELHGPEQSGAGGPGHRSQGRESASQARV
jgi:hypothetical protein